MKVNGRVILMPVWLIITLEGKFGLLFVLLSSSSGACVRWNRHVRDKIELSLLLDVRKVVWGGTAVVSSVMHGETDAMRKILWRIDMNLLV